MAGLVNPNLVEPPVNPNPELNQEGGDPPPPPAPGGIGRDNGGINPPPSRSFGEVISDWYQTVKDYLVAFHDLIFCHFSTSTRGGQAGEQNHLLDFQRKWFPENLDLFPNDSHELMKKEFGKLSPEEFKVILRAFNQVKGGDPLSEETNVAEFIDNHLGENPVFLPKEHFQGHEGLIRPYGLSKDILLEDIELLPQNIIDGLKGFVAGGEKIENYFSENMGVLQNAIQAFLVED
ncbi:MAG: hypothetical protein KDK76_05355 [Chlamydiia bacterium]|nr:hypothetical protein [Chlamydiia bacterium]